MENIKIGIIGAGGNTKLKHIPKLQEIEGVEIVSVCNRTVESGQKVADEFSILNVTANPEEIFQDKTIDAVVIGTWPNKHSELTIASLNAGKHTMCEARMARNLTEAQAMFDIANERNELIAQIVPSPFTFKYDQTLKECIESKKIGDILAVNVTGTLGRFADFERAQTWREDFEISGENIMTMGIWYEAMIRWLGEARTVFANGSVSVKNRKSFSGEGQVELTIPDHINLTGSLQNGANYSIQISQINGLVPVKNCVEIFGTTGSLILNLDEDSLKIGLKGCDTCEKIDIDPKKQGKWRVEEEFIGTIRGKEKIVYTNFTEAMKYMQFTDAVQRSLKSQKLETV